MKIGIVGSEEKKFTPETKQKAKNLIRNILSQKEVTEVVSGGCHLGGIDIWAEEIGRELGLIVTIFKPKTLKWEEYKKRNLLIANNSDEVHCITIKEYPPEYVGMKFNFCYHCKSNDHIKSGGCWTMKQTKKGLLHIIK